VCIYMQYTDHMTFIQKLILPGASGDEDCAEDLKHGLNLKTQPTYSSGLELYKLLAR